MPESFDVIVIGGGPGGYVAATALVGGAQEPARIVHPHPTVSEAVLDAARAVDGWAIHA
jgi:pyruvate/2-oxoglutarate dehydrogenase complex dihydrolipoamide dehydrogenase (E3) component